MSEINNALIPEKLNDLIEAAPKKAPINRNRSKNDGVPLAQTLQGQTNVPDSVKDHDLSPVYINTSLREPEVLDPVQVKNNSVTGTIKTIKTDKRWHELQLQKDQELTKGIFRNFERPGQSHKFSMRLFPNESKATSYEMMDGKVYMLPRGVAKYIQQFCWYPEHHDAMDENGNKKTEIKTKIVRFVFDNGEFYEDVVVNQPKLVSPNQRLMGSL